MGATSYGGIRAGAGARLAGQASMQIGAAPATGGVPVGGAGSGARQAGSPYVTARQITSIGPSSAHALMFLVLLEMALLLAARGAFRHHHGG